MQSILVLGGTGFVGSQVCKQLVRQGLHVTLPTRRAGNAGHLLHEPGVTVLEMDVHDEDALSQAVAGHAGVVNLIAILHGSAAAFDKAHVVLPQKLARVCLAQAVGKLVHVSALGVNDTRPGLAPSEYLRSKGRGEAVLQRAAAESALELTILRPSVIFGAQDKFLNLFARLQAVFPVMPLAGANARFQPVWVDDVAAAIVRSLQRSVLRQPSSSAVRIVEACGPDVFTLRELVQMAGQLSGANRGRGRPVIALPDTLGRLQAMVMELAPGPTLMSRDNLDSMKVDNVATGLLPGLQALGIAPAHLEPIAREYLRKTPRA
jgi:NADH dehydrogenase